jgi:hypothetical protein
MVAEANAAVTVINVEEAELIAGQEGVIFLDVREPGAARCSPLKP